MHSLHVALAASRSPLAAAALPLSEIAFQSGNSGSAFALVSDRTSC